MPGRRRHLGAQHLAAHPARAEVRAATCRSRSASQLRRGRAPRSRARASGSRAGSLVYRAVDVGQHDQQVGGHQDRDLRGEDVVVAEADLVGRGRVVLVDHRHDVPLEQLARACAARSRTARAPTMSKNVSSTWAACTPCSASSSGVHVVERALADRRRRPAAPRSRVGRTAIPIRRMPSAIAPEVTSVARVAACDRSSRPAGRPRAGPRARTSPRSSATSVEPSLTTRQRPSLFLRNPGIEGERDVADLDLVAGLEALRPRAP